MKEKQELHCHNCNRYVQFDMDMELNGNHVLECPNCGHEHCRVVKDGVITGDRWDSRNGDGYTVTNTSTSATSTYTTYAFATTSTTSITTGATDTSTYLYDAWMRTT